MINENDKKKKITFHRMFQNELPSRVKWNIVDYSGL